MVSPSGQPLPPSLTDSTTSSPSASRTKWLVLPAVLLATTSPPTAPGVADVPDLVIQAQTSDGWTTPARVAAQSRIQMLKEQSGLTWDEFARLFGVSRRAVHSWAAGGRMNASNSARLQEVATILDAFDGPPDQVRSRLMRPDSAGASLYTRLIQDSGVAARPLATHPLDLMERTEVDVGVAGEPGAKHRLRSHSA